MYIMVIHTAEQTCYSISMSQWTNNIPAFSTFQWTNKYSRLSVTRLIKVQNLST